MYVRMCMQYFITYVCMYVDMYVRMKVDRYLFKEHH